MATRYNFDAESGADVTVSMSTAVRQEPDWRQHVNAWEKLSTSTPPTPPPDAKPARLHALQLSSANSVSSDPKSLTWRLDEQFLREPVADGSALVVSSIIDPSRSTTAATEFVLQGTDNTPGFETKFVTTPTYVTKTKPKPFGDRVLAYYDFSNPNDLGRDVSGNDYHGVSIGPTYTNNAIRGPTCTFATVNSENPHRVDISALASSLRGRTEITFCWWFRHSVSVATPMVMLGIANKVNVRDTNDLVVFWYPGTLTIAVRDAVGGFATLFSASTTDVGNGITYNDGQWHHVAISVGPRGTLIYVDGAVRATNASTQLFNVFSPDYVYLGAHHRLETPSPGSMFSYAYAGDMGDFITLDHQASDALVTQLYNNDYGYDMYMLGGQSNMVGDGATIAVGTDDDYYSNSILEPPTITDPRVIAKYRFFNSLPAVDSSANGRTATLTGTTWLGERGGALSIANTLLSSGAAGQNPLRMDMPGVATAVNGLRNFTASFWVRYTFNSSYGPILMISNRNVVNTNWAVWYTGGRLQLAIRSAANFDIWSTLTYSDGLWHHVVASTGNAGAYLMVDGVVVGSLTQTTSVDSVGTITDALFGASIDSSGYKFATAITIAQATFFNVQLSTDQARAMYDETFFAKVCQLGYDTNAPNNTTGVLTTSRITGARNPLDSLSNGGNNGGLWREMVIPMIKSVPFRRKILLVPACQGASGFAPTISANLSWRKGDRCYNAAVSMLARAFATHAFNSMRGAVFLLGETDAIANSTVYQTDLANLYTNLKIDLPFLDDAVPFVYGGIKCPTHSDQAAIARINNDLKTYASTANTLYEFLDTSDVPQITEGSVQIHYSMAGLRSLGYRFAKLMMFCQSKDLPPVGNNGIVVHKPVGASARTLLSRYGKLVTLRRANNATLPSGLKVNVLIAEPGIQFAN